MMTATLLHEKPMRNNKLFHCLKAHIVFLSQYVFINTLLKYSIPTQYVENMILKVESTLDQFFSEYRVYNNLELFCGYVRNICTCIFTRKFIG